MILPFLGFNDILPLCLKGGFVSKNDQKKGLLVVVSGPSGVGKSTVVKRLLDIDKKLKLSVSATTRPPRPNEKKKIDYIFLSEDEFFEKEKNGLFIEWAKVHDYHYGTPRDFINDQMEKDNTVVLEVDVQGAAQIKEYVSKGKLMARTAVFVFLIPPSVDILAFRLKKRKTEKIDEMNHRLKNAIAELQVMEKYDYIIVNDKIESAADKIKAIINVEKERVLLN